MSHKLCGIIIIIGIEKNNDDAKKSNNKHDALGDILRTETTLEAGVPVAEIFDTRPVFLHSPLTHPPTTSYTVIKCHIIIFMIAGY